MTDTIEVSRELLERLTDYMARRVCAAPSGRIATGLHRELRALLAQPASAPDEVRRDAQRYRWLAERGDFAQWMNIIRVDLDDFDSLEHAIDAAMSHTPDS